MTEDVTPTSIITTSIDQPLGDIVENWTPRLHPLANPQYHILQESDTILYSIIVNDIAVGFIAFLRVNQEHDTIELGSLNFSAQLSRTRSAAEANYLLLQYAFYILGYRRVEWKFNALNAKSRRAALRLGFQYEGTWIKSAVIKGRSRDNVWLKYCR
ncbi:unnamed protein product [Rotaria sp. Silwood2]|nr:unnamed protein product [Rotaria sp. Silwood2]CAF2904992.1 unnamed protein product [Rotaria sp. Silwood2]CAF3283996.1 unnamed protein product [Rotaria sp. Silwood2]CAF4463280.1 unnamed protein product [Rotaria sp. Silwood2]CAF4563213.1 unnamed protein product [Rotaria sp. Silwood2]